MVVPGASEVPGAWVIPGGLADAHVHLTMNFGRVMPHPDGSDALVSANQGGLRRAGVLAVRDARFGLANSQAIAAISTSARAWLGFPPPQIGEPADAVTFATDPREDLSSLARPAAVLFAGDLVPLA